MNNLDNLEYDKAIEDLIKFRTIPTFNNDVKSLQILADCYWKIRKYQESKFCYDTLVKSNIIFTAVEKLHLSELSAMNGNYALASKYLLGVNGFEKKRIGYDNIARLNKEDTTIVILENKKSSLYALYPALIKDSLIWVNRAQINSAPKGSDLSKYFSSNNKIRLNSFIESTNQQNSNQTIFSNPSSYTYSTETGKIYFTIFQQFFSKKLNTNTPNYLRIAESNLEGSKVSEIINFSLGEGYYSMLQPVISPNGKVLIFISNYSNNQFDFYFSEKSNTNSWTKPKPLDILNSSGDEVFPSFGIDGFLYFSTNGREGLGGLDVYKVNLKLLGGDDLVIHLSNPINSRHDDYGFNLSEDSTEGSIISKRTGSDVFYSLTFKKKLDSPDSKIIFGKYKADLLKRDKNLAIKFLLGKLAFTKSLKPLGISKDILLTNKIIIDNNNPLVLLNEKLSDKKINTKPKIDLNKTVYIEKKSQVKKPQMPDSIVSLNENKNSISSLIKKEYFDNANPNNTKIDSNSGYLDTIYFRNYAKHKKFKSTSISKLLPKYVSNNKLLQSNNLLLKKNIALKIHEDTAVNKVPVRDEFVSTIASSKNIIISKNNNQPSDLSIDSLKNRISLKPIVFYSAADSVTIDIFDNGNFDHDTISIIYNNNIVVSKNEISTDEKKPVRFSFKINANASQNEIIIVADNLGLEPPNSAVIIITDSLKKQFIKYVSTDLLHNAVLNFVKSEKKYP